MFSISVLLELERGEILESFDFTPYGEVKKNTRYLDRVIDFESGSFQVQKVGINPIITFEATYQGTNEQMQKIEDFYNRHRKSERFYFTYNGNTYTCQFTTDYSNTDILGFVRNNNGTIKQVVKSSVTLGMRVVNYEDFTS